MNVFKLARNLSLVERVNWKAVKFRKETAPTNMRKFFSVSVNGKFVGYVGVLNQSVSRIKDWVWVRPGDSFNNIPFNHSGIGRKWVTAELLSYSEDLLVPSV